MRADFRWIDAERGNPGPYGSNPIGAYTAVDRVSRGEDTQRQLGVHGRLPWGSLLAGRIQQRWQVTVADLDNRYHSGFGDSFFETRRVTFRTQTDVVLTPTTGLTAGVEGLGERARSTYITGERFQEVPIERSTFGGFAEVRQDLGARASFSAGLRADAIRRNALEGDPNDFAPRPAFDDESVTSVNPRLAGRLVAWQDGGGVARTTVRASFGTGIRPPDAFELAFTDNPSLEPERSRSADIGVSHVLLPQLTVEATAFFNRYDDLIVAVGGSLRAPAATAPTTSPTRARGARARKRLARTSRRACAARLHMDVDGDSRGGPIRRRAAAVHGGRSADSPSPEPGGRRPGMDRSAFSAFTTVRARGEVLDIEPSFGAFGGLFTAAGFTVVDAGASWRVTPHVEIFGRGLNLLDRQYEEAFGYPAPGRLGMVGLRVDLRP